MLSPVVDAPESGAVADEAGSGLVVARNGHEKFTNIQRTLSFHVKLWPCVFSVLVNPWREYGATVEINAGHDCCLDGRQMFRVTQGKTP